MHFILAGTKNSDLPPQSFAILIMAHDLQRLHTPGIFSATYFKQYYCHIRWYTSVTQTSYCDLQNWHICLSALCQM
jgi:hypothetical protein